jgi:hypothetical protein
LTNPLLQALLQLIKHCHEEGTGTTDVAQGVLLGLMVKDVLEVTNCFPFPTHAEDLDVGKLKNLDFLHVFLSK